MVDSWIGCIGEEGVGDIGNGSFVVWVVVADDGFLDVVDEE